jgi:hypothetical protein
MMMFNDIVLSIVAGSCCGTVPDSKSHSTALLINYGHMLCGGGIHKCFGARIKTGSELIFLQIDFKLRPFPFLQMLFTKNVSVKPIF